MSIWKYSIAAMAFLFFSESVLAGEGIPTPEVLPGGTIILPMDAKSLLDQKKAMFFDVRNPINYGRGHVPSAAALPYSGKSKKVVDFDMSLDSFDVSQLPSDKNEVIIFYSHGITGWKSYKAAVSAIHAGYKNVHWMREGFGKWLELGYPTKP